MKRFKKYMNIYFVTAFIAVACLIYLISFVFVAGGITSGSSAEIHKEKLREGREKFKVAPDTGFEPETK